MLLDEVTNSGAIPLLEKTLAFGEARQKMIATNIANILTPGYRTKQLDVKGFQSALKDATRRRDEHGGSLELPRSDQLHQDEQGHLRVTPGEEPAENVLFHDGTNARIERQMSSLAENTMMYQMATEMLKSNFETISRAIRGRAI
jgi:flagellar basal-body rod protein FlgB